MSPRDRNLLIELGVSDEEIACISEYGPWHQQYYEKESEAALKKSIEELQARLDMPIQRPSGIPADVPMGRGGNS